MYNAIVMGAWGLRERNGETSNLPNLALDYPPSPDMLKCESVAQTAAQVTPDPNVNQWRITCSQATLDAIEADPKYQVVSSEEIIQEAP